MASNLIAMASNLIRERERERDRDRAQGLVSHHTSLLVSPDLIMVGLGSSCAQQHLKQKHLLSRFSRFVPILSTESSFCTVASSCYLEANVPTTGEVLEAENGLALTEEGSAFCSHSPNHHAKGLHPTKPCNVLPLG